MDEKFRLFSSVSGASDEILGSIEDGVDMEHRINQILAEFKTEEEINAAFDALEKEYSEEISEEMSKAKRKVFDNLDPDVQDRLNSYDEESTVVLNQFERLLMALTRYELRDFATFDPGGHSFTLNKAPAKDIVLGDYYFKSERKPRAHQYRYASPLARHVIDTALNSPTPEMELVFSIGDSERVSTAVRGLSGQSGQLVVRKQTFKIEANGEDLSESYLLASARTDDGKILDAEFVDDILNLTAISSTPVNIKENSEIEGELQRQAEIYDAEVKNRNSRYYNEQEDATHRSLQDRKAEHEKKIRQWETEIRNLRKEARRAEAKEALDLKLRANALEDKIDDADDEFKKVKRRLRRESDAYLDSVDQALRGSEEQEPVLAVRWKIIG